MPNHFSNWANCLDGDVANGSDVRTPGEALDDALYGFQQGSNMFNFLALAAWAPINIVAAALTPTRALHTITGGGQLDTITLTGGEHILFLRASGTDVTVRHNVGGIYLANGANIRLDAAGRRVLCLVSQGSVWIEVDSPLHINPLFDVYRSGSNQSIADSTYTKVLFNTEIADTNNNFDVVNSRFLPTVPGFYLFNLSAAWVGPLLTTTYLEVILYKNGIALRRGRRKALDMFYDSSAASFIVTANGTTDYFEMYVHQTSGGATDLSNDNSLTTFSGAFLQASS